uniref:Putative secreted protein n=1 Tax=Ixodes ricinus TaxID=34613 RepID=A0A6B0VD02_IXORI
MVLVTAAQAVGTRVVLVVLASLASPDGFAMRLLLGGEFLQQPVYLVQPLAELVLRVLEAGREPVLHVSNLLAAHRPRDVVEDHGQVAQAEDDPKHHARLVDPQVRQVLVAGDVVSEADGGECDEAVVESLEVAPLLHVHEDARRQKHEHHQPGQQEGERVGAQRQTRRPVTGTLQAAHQAPREVVSDARQQDARHWHAGHSVQHAEHASHRRRGGQVAVPYGGDHSDGEEEGVVEVPVGVGVVSLLVDEVLAPGVRQAGHQLRDLGACQVRVVQRHQLLMEVPPDLHDLVSKKVLVGSLDSHEDRSADDHVHDEHHQERQHFLLAHRDGRSGNHGVFDVRLGRSCCKHPVSMVARILSCPYPQGADGTPSTSLGGLATRTCARSRTRWRLRFEHRRRRSPQRQLLLPGGPERPLHIGPSTAHTFLRVNTTDAITHLDPVGC